jgi:hypothetical protein
VITLIYIWYLITAPADKVICSMWISQPPTRDEIIAACGTVDLQPYRLDVRDGSDTVCTLPAASLFWVQSDCYLPAALDQYSLLIIEPEHSDLICSLTLDHEGRPSAEDVAEQCPAALAAWTAGRLDAKLVSSAPRPPLPAEGCRMPSIATGAGLFETPLMPALMATHEPYALLGGRLIWWGYVIPACGSFSGLDPYTLAANPCGMASAQPKVTEWQNQFDGEIWIAAKSYSVPAVLLKRMIGIESQFWPLWTAPAGEVGIAQVTDQGIDILLRYDTELAAHTCSQIRSNCSRGYPILSEHDQAAMRAAILSQLSCGHCSPTQAAEASRQDVDLYARMLRAFYCYAGEVAEPSWPNAIAIYHAGPGCAPAPLCPAGQAYVRKLQ